VIATHGWDSRYGLADHVHRNGPMRLPVLISESWC
jgi:hypothetical protein